MRIKLVNYWDKYTEMHGQQNVKIYLCSNFRFFFQYAVRIYVRKGFKFYECYVYFIVYKGDKLWTYVIIVVFV